MKIKIIDLLNKIANGEEVPKKLIYDGVEFVYGAFTNYGDFLEGLDGKSYNGEKSGYWNDEQGGWFEFYIDFESLNETVEIPKEENKIEKLYHCCMESDNEEIKFLIKNINDLSDKFNELIDKINKLKENKDV